MGRKMKTWLTVLISVVVTGGLIGGGTYYYLHQKEAKDKNALQAQIDDLNTKVADTEKSLADAQVALTAARTSVSATTSTTQGVSSTYTDKTLGFSFTLPVSYYAFRSENFEGGHSVSIKLGKKNSDGTLDDSQISLTYINVASTLAELEKSTTANNDVIKTSATKVDGQDGVKYELGGMAGGYKVISTKGNSYVTFDNYPSSGSTILDGIVSSFKFGNS